MSIWSRLLRAPHLATRRQSTNCARSKVTVLAGRGYLNRDHGSTRFQQPAVAARGRAGGSGCQLAAYPSGRWPHRLRHAEHRRPEPLLAGQRGFVLLSGSPLPSGSLSAYFCGEAVRGLVRSAHQPAGEARIIRCAVGAIRGRVMTEQPVIIDVYHPLVASDHDAECASLCTNFNDEHPDAGCTMSHR